MGSGNKFDSTYFQLPLFNIHRSWGGGAEGCHMLHFAFHSFIHSFSCIYSLLPKRRKGRVRLVQCKRWSVRDACAAYHRRGRSPVAYPAVCPPSGRPSSIDLRPPLHSPSFCSIPMTNVGSVRFGMFAGAPSIAEGQHAVVRCGFCECRLKSAVPPQL